ncbi:hypothetical protein Aperf_G00000071283 [Anoplocephala perfoliata]
MVLVSFADIGKPSKDLFTKYFKYGLFNFDFKSKTDDDVDLHVQCKEEENRMSASADITFRPVDGVTVKTKVDSNNQFINEVELKNSSFSTQHNIIATVDQNLSQKNLKLKNSLKKENVNAEIEMDFASKLPQTTASVVVGDGTYIAGAQVLFSADDFRVKKHCYSIGYTGNDFETHVSYGDNKEAEWRFFQTYKQVSMGCMFGWTRNLSCTRFGIASLYKIDDNTFVKARVDQSARFALAYGFKPMPETQVVISMESSLDRNSPSSRGGLTVEISN